MANKENKKIKTIAFKLEKGISKKFPAIIENPFNTFTVETPRGTDIVPSGMYVIEIEKKNLFEVVSDNIFDLV